MNWNHDDLAGDLAAHLRGASDRLVWTDMQLEPIQVAIESAADPLPHIAREGA
ncbi:hypothetical protein [Burkholderia vietnamiensis]|uniref:hypothetical protein n=1 Tax=Burkholderia vietnamiensis TaxID=60552 RepID=UPI0012DB1A3D|nr:hypothetical protein [Burkholderia vietnamiensis]